MRKRKATINSEDYVTSLFDIDLSSSVSIKMEKPTSKYYAVGDKVSYDNEPYTILSIDNEATTVMLESTETLCTVNVSFDDMLSQLNSKAFNGYRKKKEISISDYINAVIVMDGRKYVIVEADEKDVTVYDELLFSTMGVKACQKFDIVKIKPLLQTVKPTVSAQKEKASKPLVVSNILSFFDIPTEETSPVKTESKINFHYNADDVYRTHSQRIADNISAVKLLKTLQNENRTATPEEQLVLSKYSGWGGLSEVFDDANSNYTTITEMLTASEYKSARNNMLTGFYTPKIVIDAIYKKLHDFGFNGGRMLEPSCGIGRFFGNMPAEMFDNSSLYGVDIDSISAEITQMLYPSANIECTGFEKTGFSDNLFDCVLTNVPFGELIVNDSRYNKYKFMIHDYFLCKMCDLVRPGGIVVAIASHGTFDKQNNSARKYIATRAELIGSVRLPNTAFNNTHTEAVTDIIFLKKRDEEAMVTPDSFVESEKHTLGNTEYKLNRYYIENPANILGELSVVSGQFGNEVTVTGEYTAEMLSSVLDTFESEYVVPVIDDAESATSIIPVPEALVSTPNFSYASYEGNIYFRNNGMLEPHTFKNAMEEKRLRAILPVKEVLLDLISAQLDDLPEIEIKELQDRLSYLYDNFVHKYGYISSRGNAMAFREDVKYPLLCSLEIFNDDGEYTGKADIFTKRTIKNDVEPKADNPSDALVVCIAEKGCIDFSYMTELTGMSENEIRENLLKEVKLFKLPFAEDKYEVASDYLSGYVKDKLELAKQAAETDEQYLVNVRELEKVQPKDIPFNEIFVTMGSTWVDIKYYEQFMYELLGTPAYAQEYLKITLMNDKYFITNKTQGYTNTTAANYTYGSEDINAYTLFEHCLNQISAKVYDYFEVDGKTKSKINREKTQVVQTKQELIRNKFNDWVWNDIDRRELLVRKYNDLMNNIVECTYDGSKIRFVGANSNIELMPHQKDAVARIIQNGNTLLAHVVGAGKTYTMIAAAMEKKRLGLCNKPLFVVPNHLVEQWAGEFLRLYPFANVLITSKKDFHKDNRKKFCSRIATGNFDAVIMSHEQFKAIPLSKERQEAEINNQIEEVEQMLNDEIDFADENFEVRRYKKRQYEIRLNNLVKMLEKLADSTKESGVTFEELGVDCLFLDEAHMFKNLAVPTKLSNIAGLTNANSQKAQQLLMKVNYLNEITDYKGVIFATGTPISNAICELYVMQKYLQDSDLESHGIYSFDSWISRFAETETKVEVKPEGTGYRTVTRVCKYHNLPELMKLFRLVADIRVADQLELAVPERRNHNVAVSPSETQAHIVENFAVRAEAIRNGCVDSSVDNMLCVTNDGRKLAIDQRLYDESLEDDKTSKLNRMTRTVYAIWKKTISVKATQLIFSDMGTPKTKGKESFDCYNDIKSKLVSFGVPTEEIVFIHEANTDAKKKALFEKVNKGDVRVLIGSTEKLGAGTNVQKRLIAIHNLDCPWRPSDLEQRAGRIVRQGNLNTTVYVYSYVTKNTFDTYLYQTILNKAKPIAQIMSSKEPQRDMVDVDTACLNYAEIKALSTGNPAIKEKMELEEKVTKLKILRSSHITNKFTLEAQIKRSLPREIEGCKAKIYAMQTDIDICNDNPLDEDTHFAPMEIKGISYTVADKKKCAELLQFYIHTHKETARKTICKYRGFNIAVGYDIIEDHSKLFVVSTASNFSYPLSVGDDGLGNITRINNLLANISVGVTDENNKLARLEKSLEDAKAEYELPFEKEDEYNECVKRLAELDKKLSIAGSNGIENIVD